MKKLKAIVHTSLDGYTAYPDGSLNGFTNEPDNLAHVCAITESADTALLGRKTFQLLNDYWPSAAQLPNATADMIRYSGWYNAADKYVLSSTLKKGEAPNAQIIHTDFVASLQSLKQKDGKDILIFGSPSTVQQLISLQLLDGIWIFQHPVLFGDGIPLFKPSTIKHQLQLQQHYIFGNGMIALEYRMGINI
ncbi:MAG: dihydrofolate reductase family protein [Bacteroidetes bacterium]|nr:dihydrofolate reductase family protein [Bacteroidota bacterium]